MTKRQRRTNLVSLLVGLAATLAVLVSYQLGALDKLELDTLDLRFQYANPTQPSDDIAIIGIDDDSLEIVDRWPWPRFKQAPLIEVAALAGARCLLIDLTWVEHETIAANPESDLDLRTRLTELQRDQIDIQLSDYQLRRAVAEAGSAYLGYHYRKFDLTYAPDFLGPGGVVAQIADNRLVAAQALAAELDAQPGRDVDFGAFDRARLVYALSQFPQLDAGAVGAMLSLPPIMVRDFYQDALRAALRWRLQQRYAADPNFAARPTGAQFATLYAELDPNGDSAAINTLTSTLELALRETLSYRATVRGGLDVDAPLRNFVRPVDRIVPTYFLLSEVARGCGFTVSDPDFDGVMRHMPLMVRHGQNVVPQLAFGLACGEKDWTPRLVVSGLFAPQYYIKVGDIRMQVDARCRAVIPWLAERRWERHFGRMVPADALWQVHDRRQKIADNAALVEHQRWQLFSSGLFPGGADYAKRAQRLADHRWRLEIARYQADEAAVTTLRPQVAEDEVALADLEVRMRTALQQAADDPNEAAGFRDPAWITRQLSGFDEFAAEVETINADLAAEADATLGRLRKLLGGKICLIGYTATALPDTTPTPTNPDVPGVMAHANLLNGLLTGHTVAWVPEWFNVLVAGLLGVLTTIIVVWRGPREALLVVVGLGVAYVALAGGLAFYGWMYWIALAPAVGAMAAATFAIAFYRYVFADRERRQLATALGQYTSREIARQVAEDPELCKRAEMREVTTIFTDLKGFTTISERIGAERTQEVLNVCLGRLTQVLMDYEAMVNKFLGDGIFAFWNPVIYPQSDHAARACEAAIDLLAALEQLRLQRTAAGDGVYADLQLRVGLATGNAIVGPCGSEQKFDYTCIGDSVNVASRLESANKFYGTQVLVGGTTRDAVGDRFEFRPLGGVQVKGKRYAVPIYELLGRRGEVPQDLIIYAEKFGRGIERFQQRQWQDAAAIFGARLLQRPHDFAAARYAELCARYQDLPPDDDWNGAIELTEK